MRSILRYKNILLIGILSFFGLVGTAMPPKLKPLPIPDALCEQTVTSGHDWYPPYQSSLGYGELTGLDIELMESILSHIKYCMNPIQSSSLEKNLEYTKSGEVHLVAGMSKVKEREEYALYTHPYRTEDVGLFLKGKESLEKRQNKSLEELLKDGFKLGIIRNQSYGKQFDEDLKKRFSQQITEVVSYVELITLFKTEQVDGIMNDAIAMWHQLSTQLKSEELGTIYMHPLLVNEKDDRNIYIIVSKNAPNAQKIVEDLNKGIAHLINSGAYLKIMKKYFKDYKPASEFAPTPKKSPVT